METNELKGGGGGGGGGKGTAAQPPPCSWIMFTSLKVFNIYRLMSSSNFHKKTNNLANIKAKQRRMLSFKQ